MRPAKYERVWWKVACCYAIRIGIVAAERATEALVKWRTKTRIVNERLAEEEEQRERERSDGGEMKGDKMYSFACQSGSLSSSIPHVSTFCAWHTLYLLSTFTCFTDWLCD